MTENKQESLNEDLFSRRTDQTASEFWPQELESQQRNRYFLHCFVKRRTNLITFRNVFPVDMNHWTLTLELRSFFLKVEIQIARHRSPAA